MDFSTLYNKNSRSFLISNGGGQGKIPAGYAYFFYCCELFDLLEKSGYGCRINGIYAGIFGYSDEDFILSPTTSGLQGMLLNALRFCNEHGLKFCLGRDSNWRPQCGFSSRFLLCSTVSRSVAREMIDWVGFGQPVHCSGHLLAQ